MKEISLNKGHVALVDDEDFERVNKLRWFFHKGTKEGSGYARNRTVKNRIATATYLHRFILGIIDSKIHVDHIDHNGLNNQKYNLRIATSSQNNINRIKTLNYSSKYKGVSYFKKGATKSCGNHWKSAIQKDGKGITIGYYKTEEEAAKIYNEFALKLHGEFAVLNKLD